MLRPSSDALKHIGGFNHPALGAIVRKFLSENRSVGLKRLRSRCQQNARWPRCRRCDGGRGPRSAPRICFRYGGQWRQQSRPSGDPAALSQIGASGPIVDSRDANADPTIAREFRRNKRSRLNLLAEEVLRRSTTNRRATYLEGQSLALLFVAVGDSLGLHLGPCAFGGGGGKHNP